MDKDIKTRNVIKDIKVLDKKAVMSSGLREARAKTKEVAEQADSGQQVHRHGGDYAQEKVEQTVSNTVSEGAREVVKDAKKAAEKARDSRGVAKGAKQGVQSASIQAAQRNTVRSATTSKQTVGKTATTTKGNIKQGSKGTVKTTHKTIKTAGATAKTTVKTSRQAAQGAKAAAKTSQVAARNAAHVTRASAKAAAAAIRAVAKGIAVFAKMAIAAVKSLIAAIAAGGWVAVAVVLVICLVGLIATNAFGIFFAGGDMGDGNPSLREVIVEINDEHTQKIEDIKQANVYDEVALSGSKTQWKQVLAVFAVKTTTNPDEPLDAVTLDTKRQEILRDIFWDMNAIEHRIVEHEITEIVLEEDGGANLQETTKTYTVKTLYITLTRKSADEIAATYGFTPEQYDLLHELLDSQYDSTWQTVLYGIKNGSGDIVEVAATQLGNVGGQPYWSWYGFNGRVEWCACYVSWCANECGYIEAGIIPRFSYCQTGISWFKEAGLWQDRGYEPKPGDIIFFDWGNGSDADHVGIVKSCDGV